MRRLYVGKSYLKIDISTETFVRCVFMYVRGSNPIGTTWQLSRGERRNGSAFQIHADTCTTGSEERNFHSPN